MKPTRVMVLPCARRFMGSDEDIAEPLPTAPPRRRRLIEFGDSAIARGAILMAVLLMLTLAGASWWTSQVRRSAMAAARENQIAAAQSLLRETSELLLSEGDISA